jgi:NAD-dependent dihydropyrimidine dehydrogenase PreA subunit/flavodoxin
MVKQPDKSWHLDNERLVSEDENSNMKSIIIYYSQSGNTKKIAQAIHAGMRQVTEVCDITPLKAIKAQDLSGYDLIGLGGPVWRRREPANIQAFIESMAPSKGKHGFAFSTHGTLPGEFMKNVLPALTRKGITVIGFNDWYGSVFHPYLPKPYFTDGHPDEIDLKEAEDFGREMGEHSQRIFRGETQLIPKLPEGKEWEKIYWEPPPLKRDPGLIKARIRTQKQMKINEEKCTRCGLCEENCPTNSIDFSVSPPVIKDDCTLCWFCEQICPVGAIEVDWEPIAKIHDLYIENPLAKSLEVAEAQGRFRRLVPLEKIGWNTHWYKVSGHPRLKVP